MKYRPLKAGEIVQPTDEYQPMFSDRWFPVNDCTVGQPIYACNTPYYRRPIIDEKQQNLFDE